jgi:hypothetical protein
MAEAALTGAFTAGLLACSAKGSQKVRRSGDKNFCSSFSSDLLFF